MIEKSQCKLTHFYQTNELFIKIVSVVIISILLVSGIISLAVLKISERAYIESYRKSNDIILTQVQSDYESLNDNIVNMLTSISQSQEVVNYVTNDSESPQVINRFFYEFKDKMTHTNILDKKIPSNLILVGENGNVFYQNDARRMMTTTDLLASDLLQEAKETPQNLHFQYLTHGLTSITHKQPVIAIVKVLFNEEAGVFGYAIISITERDFSAFYSKLIDNDVNTISIIDASGQTVSSNKGLELAKKLNTRSLDEVEHHLLAQKQTPLLELKHLYSFNLLLASQIDQRQLAKKMVVLPTILALTLATIVLVSIIAFFIIRRTTQPIYLLTKSLPKITQGDFSQKIPIQGSSETKELARVYNGMLEDLNAYVAQLVTVENQKRMAEIHALQMQIQPHFIYNTLTSIKFLIWQDNQEKAILAMDAFIRLLRHTIGESQEFVTLDEELMSIRDYILILQIRFGENIVVDIHEGTVDVSTLIPKMILQPIIENTFIHAFPQHHAGKVDLFIKQSADLVSFEIIDNGVGMSDVHLERLARHADQRQNHFSGVGLDNINRRLQLIYGPNCGLKIASQKGLGTTIKLTILRSILGN